MVWDVGGYLVCQNDIVFGGGMGGWCLDSIVFGCGFGGQVLLRVKWVFVMLVFKGVQ